MKKVLLTVVAGMALLVGMAAPATAATTGAQRFTILYVGNDGVGTNLASGPIQGVGKEVEVSFDEGTGVDVVTFRNGTVTLTHTETDSTSTFNDRTCVGRAFGAGTYTLDSGTGAYAGISGSGTFSYRSTFIAEHTADGCGDDGTAFTTVRAAGTTTLP